MMAYIRYTDGISYDPNNSDLYFDVSNSFLYDGPSSGYTANFIDNDPTYYGVRNNHTGSYSYSSDGKQYAYYDDFSDNTGVVELIGSNYGDILFAGTNADTLSGGAGNDTLEGGAGADTLSGGDGSDTLSYEHSSAAVNANLSQSSFAGGDALGDSVAGIENLRGSQGNDNLTGDDGDNVIEGGPGADALDGGEGVDTLSYEHSAAPVNVALGQARRTDGDAFGDTATGFENVKGSQGNDNLAGDDTDNVIEGGAGGDALDGQGGRDTLSYAGSAQGVTVNLSTGTSTGGDAQDDSFYNFESLIGTAFTDLLTGDGNANAIDGQGGNDTLKAGAGNDTVVGGAGNDALDGGTGNDDLTGGAGDDRFYVDSLGDIVRENAGEGIDNVYASKSYTLTAGAYVEYLRASGSGNFALTGNDQSNSIVGGAGNDTLDGGSAGTDKLYGGLGNDTYIVGRSGLYIYENAGDSVADTVQASIGYTLGVNVENLTLTGTSAINGTGNALANIITGNAKVNTLQGGAGNDTIVGGGGADRLYGNAGSDTFVFKTLSDSALTARDGIYDFVEGGTDKIDLSGIDANAYLTDDQAFTLVSAYTGAAGQLRAFSTSTLTYVEGDVNGDRKADFQILLSGVHTLQAGDFVL